MTDAKPTQLTARTIADSDIRRFLDGAAQAGDFDAVRLCRKALSRRGGRGAVAAMINDARAEAC